MKCKDFRSLRLGETVLDSNDLPPRSRSPSPGHEIISIRSLSEESSQSDQTVSQSQVSAQHQPSSSPKPMPDPMQQPSPNSYPPPKEHLDSAFYGSIAQRRARLHTRLEDENDDQAIKPPVCKMEFDANRSWMKVGSSDTNDPGYMEDDFDPEALNEHDYANEGEESAKRVERR